jgi:hypothetical protein
MDISKQKGRLIMKKKSNVIKTAWLMVVFLGIGLTGVPSSVQASAFYFGESYIDWPSLEFSGIPVTWLGKKSSSWSYLEDDFNIVQDTDSFIGWDNAFTEAFSSVSQGQAYSSTDNDFLTQKLSAQVDGLDTAVHLEARADRFGDFIADESGIFTVSVKYSLFQELRTDELGEFVFGHTGAAILINDSKDETTFGATDALFNTVVDGNKLKLAKSGMLKLDVPFDKGEYGTLLHIGAHGNALVYEVAPQTSAVPEPSTMALLGVGLTGVLLKRRRLIV